MRIERSDASLGYRLAVVEHLAGTEAMLTSFRTSAARGAVDPDVAAWARRLVRETRLLAAAPAASADPGMRRLFDDLEVVLVQIATYQQRDSTDRESLAIIERSIDRRNVLPQIRTSLPSRLRVAGS